MHEYRVTRHSSCRSEQERLKHKARQAGDHVTGLRRQLDDRSREVEQLTTLSLKGDATLQEYMSQLTVSLLSFMKLLGLCAQAFGCHLEHVCPDAPAAKLA